MKQLHADLLSLGYEGSYGRVAAFAREWKADLQREQQTSGRGTFVPLTFEPGEAFQFDWSEDWAIRDQQAAARAPTQRGREAYTRYPDQEIGDARFHHLPGGRQEGQIAQTALRHPL